MAVLPRVLGCRPLRRTTQVRLGSNTLRLPGTRRKRLRCAWHTHLRGLATAIHETSGLEEIFIYSRNHFFRCHSVKYRWLTLPFLFLYSLANSVYHLGGCVIAEKSLELCSIIFHPADTQNNNVIDFPSGVAS